MNILSFQSENANEVDIDLDEVLDIEDEKLQKKFIRVRIHFLTTLTQLCNCNRKKYLKAYITSADSVPILFYIFNKMLAVIQTN